MARRSRLDLPACLDVSFNEATIARPAAQQARATSTTARTAGSVIQARLRRPRLRVDDKLRIPSSDTRTHRCHLAHDESDWPTLRRQFQCAPPAHRHAAGGTTQRCPGRYRPLSAHLLPPHRAQSRQSRHDRCPSGYPWSSHHHNALGAAHCTDHPARAVHPAGRNTCRTAVCLPHAGQRTNRREPSRRSFDCTHSNSVPGAANASSSRRSPDSARSRRQTAWKAAQITPNRDQMNLTFFLQAAPATSPRSALPHPIPSATRLSSRRCVQTSSR